MNILTFDLEDWFHILDHAATEKPEQWVRYESRIENNVNRILAILDELQQSTTWFCLGWIAEKYPDLIKKISARHEIAAHSDSHQLVYRQSRKEFREDTISVIKRLEDLTGEKINTYRASGFSITAETKWAFEELLACGITSDCSVFPANRNHGGFPEFANAEPCRIYVNGMQLKEFPMNTVKLLGKKIVFSGGGYFRALPYTLIKNMTRNSTYVMTYFHPRDFDKTQPVLSSLPWHRKWMSYVGLQNSERKFKKWLMDFDFTDLRTADALIDWDQAKIIQL